MRRLLLFPGEEHPHKLNIFKDYDVHNTPVTPLKKFE